jgi:cell division protein FtsB
MKKSFKPLIIVITSMLVLITILLLVAQGIRLKYEELQRESAQLENQIKTEKNIMVNLKANYQMLTAEDVIKPYALNELGLVSADSDTTDTIIISKKDIDNLNEKLQEHDE